MRPPTRRQEILHAAGDLFRHHGYHATSMRDIAGRLNLRGSSLYSHIESKEQLLREIVDEAADAFLEAAETDPEEAPAARLEQLVRGHLRVMVRELRGATVFFHEWRFLPEESRREIVARRDAYQQHFRDAIERGGRDGSFRVADPHLATLFVLSALNWSYQWLDPRGRLDLDGLGDRYLELIMSALGDEPRRPRRARKGDA